MDRGRIFIPLTGFSCIWTFNRKFAEVSVLVRDSDGFVIAKHVRAAAGVGDAERIAGEILDLSVLT